MFPSFVVIASLIDDWASSPGAVTSASLGVLGLVFAFYQFRFIPRERKRETLDAMQKSFALSRDNRGAVLPALPHFLLDARDDLRSVLEAGPLDRADLAAALDAWPEPTETAAHEILGNEAKFRCVLFAIERVHAFEANVANEGAAPGLLAASRELVRQLNDFAQLVELDLFAEGDVLSHFHRGLAPACKAVEPLVWAGNVRGGRWGLRVLRLQLRAEHFNDVRRIHRASSLEWRGFGGTPQARRTLIRPSLYRDHYGEDARSAGLSRVALVRLTVAAAWARVRDRYGGRRLRRHTRSENKLLGRLRFALEREDPRGEHRLDPGDLTWRLEDVDAMVEAARRAQRQIDRETANIRPAQSSANGA